MSGINQKEYLKKYLSKGGEKEKKKKRKKKAKTLASRVRIIDDDVEIFNTAVQEDLLAANEDAPQIVGIIDERPLELRMDDFKTENVWQQVSVKNEVLSDDEDDDSTSYTNKNIGSSNSSSRGRIDEGSPGVIQDRNNSPPRRKTLRHDSPRMRDVEDSPLQRKRRDNNSSSRGDDNSPRRRGRDNDGSSSRRRKNDGDSPLRRSGRNDSSPRRKNNDVSPIRRNDDFSPRKRQIDDGNQLRRRNDGKDSPPRRRKNNADAIQPGRRYNDEGSPYRRRNDDNKSPPRTRNSDHLGSPKRRNDTNRERKRKNVGGNSPKRKNTDDPITKGRYEDESSPRGRKSNDEYSLRNITIDGNGQTSRQNLKSITIKHETDDNRSPRKLSSDDDNSPPRRRNIASTSIGKSIKSENNSPPRNWLDEDNSPPRRRPAGADSSPPRRRREDNSPIRKNRNHDMSPPRDRHCSQSRRSHNSAPKIREVTPSSGDNRNTSATYSGQNIANFSSMGSNSRGDTVVSPARNSEAAKPTERKRKTKWDNPATTEKLTKTLDGKAAGLQNARDLVQETQAFKKREDDLFNNMSTEVSGANATTILRDRRTGKIRDLEKEAADKQDKAKKQEAVKEKYDKWGKGTKQVEDYNEKLQQDVYEMSKPLARYADDEDLEQYLKEQERDGDPMLAYIRKKKRKDAVETGKPLKPQYEGEFMPNRFGIRPGHKWDGVDRTNGYEKKWFEVINAKHAQREEVYRWNTEDM